MNKRSGIESKKRIIAAAMEVFSREGYAKASMREIAKASGLSIGGVYLYFRNKEELYKSLINNKMRDIASKLEKAAGTTEPASAALSHFLTLHLENALKNKEFILLHIREHGFAFGREVKKRFFRNQQELIEKIIVRGIHEGEFRRCNASETAKLVMGALRGIVLSVALDDITVTPRIMNAFVLNGLLRSGKS